MKVLNKQEIDNYNQQMMQQIADTGLSNISWETTDPQASNYFGTTRNGFPLLQEAWQGYSDAPYSTYYMTKVAKYWHMALSKYSILLYGKDDKVNEKETKKFEKELRSQNIFEKIEILVKRTIQNGTGIMWVYDDNKNKTIKTAYAIIKIQRGINDEITYLRLMDLLKSGTEVLYLSTEITPNGIKFDLVANQDGLSLSEAKMKEAKKTYKDNFGKFPTNIKYSKAKPIKAAILKFNTELSNTAFGVADRLVVNDRLKKADVIWNKIIEDILWRSTSINIEKNNGSSIRGSGSYDNEIEDTDTRQEQTKISSKMTAGVRVNTFDVGNNDESEMTIITDRSDPSQLSIELDKEMQRIDKELGVNISSDNRSFQSSEKEEDYNNQDAIDTMKDRIGRMVMFLEKMFGFMTKEEFSVTIPYQDPKLYSQALKEPKKLYQSGMSKAQVYSILTGKPIDIATKEIIDNNDVMKKDPQWFALAAEAKLPLDKIKGLAFMDKELINKQLEAQVKPDTKESTGKKEQPNPPSPKGV